MIRLFAVALVLCCTPVFAGHKVCVKQVQQHAPIIQALPVVYETRPLPFYAANYVQVGQNLRDASIVAQLYARIQQDMLQQQQQVGAPQAVAQPQSPAYAVLQQNCVRCHNQANASAGISMTNADGTWAAIDWERFYAQVRNPPPGTQKMPPGGELKTEDLLLLCEAAKWEPPQAVTQPVTQPQTACADGTCEQPNTTGLPASADEAQAFAAEISALVKEEIQAALAEHGLLSAEERGKNLFVSKCLGCHSKGELAENQPRFGALDAAGAISMATDLNLVDLYGAAKFGSMPKDKPLTDEEFRDFEAWLVRAGLDKQ